MFFITGASKVDGSIGKHHEIDHYEIAIGTDRRYPSTRTNVWPFTNVGLNVTWTVSDLTLIPRKVIYYVTVRAYSVSSAMVDVTSNGIRVGYGSHVISTGTIELAKYVAEYHLSIIKVTYYAKIYAFVLTCLAYYYHFC